MTVGRGAGRRTGCHRPDPVFDVAVIGAGVVGSAIARELSGHALNVVLLDARDDVGDGTSKANTAILHTGFDAKPGTLESRLVKRGYELLSDAREADRVSRSSRQARYWSRGTATRLDALPGLQRKAAENGYDRCEIVGTDQVYRSSRIWGRAFSAGSRCPDESIICTWTTTLALATDARPARAELRLGQRIEHAEIGTEHTVLRGPAASSARAT